MQVLCGLQVVFFLFNCQTPEHIGLKQTAEGLFWFLAFKQRKKVIYYLVFDTF